MIMSFHRYFSAIFAAGVLSASPMIAMAEDDSDNRDHPSVNVYGDPTPEEMRARRSGHDWNSDESLAQLSDEPGEPLATGYCFTESVIDESTGEVLAFRQICEQEAADLA
jgi:hypothetical protein